MLDDLRGHAPHLVITDPDIMAGYCRDQSRLTESGLPIAVLAPATTAEVSTCLKWASSHGVPVVPRGLGSGLSGGANAVAGGVVLSLHRMNRIKDLDAREHLAVVEPGVITAQLRSAVSAVGLFYPPDPGSVEFCSIGGNVATNAGGMCCVKYGVTGDFVEALEIVLADGQILRTGGRTVKGVAGLDLTSLFVGSEGTLGVVTEVTVRLRSQPSGPLQTLAATFADLGAAGRVVTAIVAEGLRPSLLEILDRTTIQAVNQLVPMGLEDCAALLLVQIDDADDSILARIESLCAAAGADDLIRSESPQEADMLLEARRMALPALERLGDWLLDDVCVPCHRIAELLESIEQISDDTGLRIGVFGHAGDGNLHPTIIYDASEPEQCDLAAAAFDRITAAALGLGGTITGEHGVGRLKMGWLKRELDPVAFSLHGEIKHALDPKGILNPESSVARSESIAGHGQLNSPAKDPALLLGEYSA